MANPTLSMKLLIDPEGRRVLFAEAGKDVVDFLFSILSLPLGSVLRLENHEDMAWSIGNLYQSIEDLKKLHMIPNKNIDYLANRSVHVTYPTTANSPPMLLSTDGQSSTTRQSFSSSSPSSSMEGGFVKGGVTYMIMDDLVVKPMSTISTIALFNRLNLKEVGALEEKTVNLTTIDEIGKFLRASLRTKKVLTKVFFKEKKVVEEEKSLASVE